MCAKMHPGSCYEIAKGHQDAQELKDAVLANDFLVKDQSAASVEGNALQAAQDHGVWEEDGFSYADVSDLTFCFSSGVGAWSTIMEIHEDGSFEGNFHDSDMGDSGEGYPNGTVYFCDFRGQFSEPVRVNEYTYSAEIQNMELERESGTSEIIDGIRYIYSGPYGFDNAEAGAEVQGGSLQPLVENATAANLTRIRVYELADYLR